MELTDMGRFDRREYDKNRPARSRSGKRTPEAYENAKTRAYLSRQFIAWDGEGVTNPDGSHDYILMANSLGERLWSKTSLSTQSCLEFLLRTARRNPGCIHVIYGGSYDTNMILADLTKEQITRVYSQPRVKIGRFTIRYRAGKSLWVTDGETSITLYDVVSFFQCRFTKACADYLGNYDHREMIENGKANRSNFQRTDRVAIQSYCDAELSTLVLLMVELRSRLTKVDLKVKRWDGPGAIAATLLQRESIKQYKDSDIHTATPDVARASRYAYAGGRFELVRYGHIMGPIYVYDINSAYPYALQNVPSLRDGVWTHRSGKTLNELPSQFSLYHIEYDNSGGRLNDPHPLFRRNRSGTVCFPPSVRGWYWTPEANLVLDTPYCRVLERMDYYPVTAYKPFAFIADLYAQRQELKAAGDGANVGLKLALNSLYGKTAQQIGWQAPYKESPLRLPPFHQLEWAGYITSYCRSMIYTAGLQTPGDVIAHETDAIFSLSPLALDIGSGLGQWEETIYDEILYVQSGFYWARKGDVWSLKSRGFDADSITLEATFNAYNSGEPLQAQQTRFIAMGQAIHQDWSKWRTWQTEPRNLAMGPSGKRVHADYGDGCSVMCSPTKGHATYVAPWEFKVEDSFEFPIAWINPNPEMSELEEMRRESYEQWQ